MGRKLKAWEKNAVRGKKVPVVGKKLLAGKTGNKSKLEGRKGGKIVVGKKQK